MAKRIYIRERGSLSTWHRCVDHRAAGPEYDTLCGMTIHVNQFVVNSPNRLGRDWHGPMCDECMGRKRDA